jgi:hypothetical protein
VWGSRRDYNMSASACRLMSSRSKFLTLSSLQA